LNFSTTGVYHVTITNLTGNILLRQIVSDQITQLDISSYPEGVYLVIIDNGQRQNATKLVKTK